MILEVERLITTEVAKCEALRYKNLSWIILLRMRNMCQRPIEHFTFDKVSSEHKVIGVRSIELERWM